MKMTVFTSGKYIRINEEPKESWTMNLSFRCISKKQEDTLVEIAETLSLNMRTFSSKRGLRMFRITKTIHDAEDNLQKIALIERVISRFRLTQALFNTILKQWNSNPLLMRIYDYDSAWDVASAANEGASEKMYEIADRIDAMGSEYMGQSVQTQSNSIEFDNDDLPF